MTTPSLVGNRFQINSFRDNAQQDVEIIAQPPGFLVKYESIGLFSTATIDNGKDIASAFVNLQTGPVEQADSQISPTTVSGNQSDPAAAVLGDGITVVTAFENSGLPGAEDRISVLLAATGTETMIQADPGPDTLAEFSPSITALTDGGFTAIWSRAAQGATQRDVALQRFDSEARPVVGDMVLLAGGAQDDYNGTLAVLGDMLLAAWEGEGHLQRRHRGVWPGADAERLRRWHGLGAGGCVCRRRRQ